MTGPLLPRVIDVPPGLGTFRVQGRYGLGVAGDWKPWTGGFVSFEPWQNGLHVRGDGLRVETGDVDAAGVLRSRVDGGEGLELLVAVGWEWKVRYRTRSGWPAPWRDFWLGEVAAGDVVDLRAAGMAAA